MNVHPFIEAEKQADHHAGAVGSWGTDPFRAAEHPTRRAPTRAPTKAG